MNPLNNYPALRQAAYIFQWVVNLVLGVMMIVLTANGDSPQWYVILTGVFNFLWTYLGLTAQTNTVQLDPLTDPYGNPLDEQPDPAEIDQEAPEDTEPESGSSPSVPPPPEAELPGQQEPQA